MSRISYNPPYDNGTIDQKVLLFSRDSELIHKTTKKLKEHYDLIVRKSPRGFRRALRENPGIVVIDADCGNASESAMTHLHGIHENRTGAYGTVILSRRSNTEIGRWSGYLGKVPIITRGNIIQLNGEWKEAIQEASSKREELEHKIRRLSVGVVGYGRVGRAFIHSSVSGEGESFDIKVTSRNTPESHKRAESDIEENFQLRKSRCNVSYTQELNDILDTDIMFVALKDPHGQRPKAPRDWCWQQNAHAIEELGRHIRGYEGMVVCVTNLPEVNTYLLRNSGEFANHQVAALGNVDAIRLDKYANYSQAKKKIDLEGEDEINDCFVFGAHDNPVPAFSLMRSDALKTGLVQNNEKSRNFEKYVRNRLSELPEYIIHHRGNTDGTTGFAMIDVTKAVYDQKLVTLGIPYAGDLDHIPLQKPCVIKKAENEKLRAYAAGLRPSEEEIDRILDAREKIMDYLTNYGKDMPKSILEPQHL